MNFGSNESYYEIILNYLKYSLKLDDKDDYDFSIFFKDKFDFSYINKKICDKVVFYYHDKNIYIKPQESGSCTWFSIYWPLLYFYITNNNKEKYYGMIKKIYDTFLKLLGTIFKQDDFINTSTNCPRPLHSGMPLVWFKKAETDAEKKFAYLTKNNDLVVFKKEYEHLNLV
jgi:hypothetical protein